MLERLKNYRFASMVLSAILLILVLAGGLYVAYVKVTTAVRRECDDNLNIATDQFTNDVHAYFVNQQGPDAGTGQLDRPAAGY